jgi:hypothetical protein
MRLGRVLSLLSLSLVAAGPASAAGLWLGTEPISPQPGQTIVVRLFDDEGRERPYRAEDVGRFQRLWRSGRTDVHGEEGRTPVARFVADRAGVVLVVFDSADGREFCKALVVVGSPESGDPLRWSEVGQRLEIVPQSDPIELRRKPGRLELQVLFGREPLAGAVVMATPLAEPSAVRRARTDEIGVARLKLDSPGVWRVETTHGDPGKQTPFSATLQLVVGPTN